MDKPLTLAWPAKLTPDEDGRIVVTFPDFTGGATDGADRAEALEAAADCLEELIAMHIAHGLDIPIPSRRRAGQVLVTLGPLFAGKAALYLAMRASGTRKTELARRMKCDEKEIRRLLDPKHNSSISRIAEALTHFQVRLQVSMEAA